MKQIAYWTAFGGLVLVALNIYIKIKQAEEMK